MLSAAGAGAAAGASVRLTSADIATPLAVSGDVAGLVPGTGYTIRLRTAPARPNRACRRALAVHRVAGPRGRIAFTLVPREPWCPGRAVLTVRRDGTGARAALARIRIAPAWRVAPG